MLLALCVSTYFTYKVADNRRDVISSQLEVVTATERLEQYGIILELAVTSAANGDTSAAAKYNAIQPRLQATVNELRSKLRFEEDKATAAQIHRADLALVAMEREALERASNGDLAAARRIVTSPEYDRLVSIYTSGTDRIQSRAKTYVRKSDQELVWFSYADLAVTLSAFAFVVLGWIALVRPTREWGAKLNTARADAERATQDLEDSKAELVLLNQRLFEQARVDELTQVATRRKFYEDVAQLWPKAESHVEDYCLVMCDIDCFKQYNDTYGHLEGDKALKRVADALTSICRGDERVYRMGGEEFVILLPHHSFEEGKSTADRFRRAVENLAIPHSKNSFEVVTISIGIAPFETGPSASLDKWLARADAALYEAKHSGRNQVVAAVASSQGEDLSSPKFNEGRS